MPSVPIGSIVGWTLPISAIPRAWSLCDGTNGTPDLRDRFIPGAGTIYNPDDTGGSASHTHGFTGDGHLHSPGIGTGLEFALFDQSEDIEIPPISGTTDATPNLPPFYALTYIIYTAFH